MIFVKLQTTSYGIYFDYVLYNWNIYIYFLVYIYIWNNIGI